MTDVIWITIPTYNEADNIGLLVSEIRKAVPDAVIAIVDDNSPDGTGDIVEGLVRKDQQIVLIKRRGKEGYATAIVRGLQEGLKRGALILGQMDADFSHDPKSIPALLQALKEGGDIAIGSRYVQGGRVEGWSPWRLFLSRSANLAVQVLLQVPLADATSGFRFYQRSALEHLPLDRLQVEGYGFLYLSAALAVWKGLKVRQVPILFRDRRQGKSKLSRRILWEAAVALLKIWIWRHTGRWLGKPLIQTSPQP
ncbi:MAG: polyprenol monophosphomannose synthase [Armatimonadetes bacterium]|nr:polyprenol monophosphomannose synthase [Armatimonadota bacterium]MDW8122515.1 polyprenol monophosphomannose synthase [Armatimonadota bacterium]